jgi:acyl-CoA reductase-like NAD-dependent aldehyde dehydrogenase
MTVADGFELGAVIGPLTDTKAVEKVEAHIADVVGLHTARKSTGKRELVIPQRGESNLTRVSKTLRFNLRPLRARAKGPS